MAADADGLKKAVSGASAVGAIVGKNVNVSTGIPTLTDMSDTAPASNAMYTLYNL